MKRNDRQKSVRLRLAALAATTGIAAIATTAALRESRAAESAGTPATQGEAAVREARGEFDVKMAPLAQDEGAGATLGRMSLEKTFRGALVASGKGEMLTAMTKTPGSAVYVALERVTGTLDGRRGSFALAHRGEMHRGRQSLSITVVPDSGTEELAGLEGTLTIDVRDGRHYYAFAYRLPRA